MDVREVIRVYIGRVWRYGVVSGSEKDFWEVDDGGAEKEEEVDDG